MSAKELKDRMLPIYTGLPSHVIEWAEGIARAERRKPSDVYRNIIVDRYEAEAGGAARRNGADKHINGKRA